MNPIRELSAYLAGWRNHSRTHLRFEEVLGIEAAQDIADEIAQSAQALSSTVYRERSKIVAVAAAGFLLTGCAAAPQHRLKAPARAMIGFTGSMQPTFRGGEFVRVEALPFEQVKVGDIVVAYQAGKDWNVPHRVVRIGTAGNGERYLLTKGDANRELDRPVTAENYVGTIRP